MADIDLTPTEEMAANAKRGLELRRKHGRGGTAVGVARARDISNRKTLSPETVRRMHAFFSRHEKNKAGGEDDAGYIAWLLWGGDSGQGWAKRKVEQMDKSENQRSETYKAIAERLGSAAKHERSGDKPNGSEAVEAYGVKGMKSTPWRKVFKSVEAMQKWVEANDAEIYGTRPANESFSRPGAKAKFAEQTAKRIGAWGPSNNQWIIDEITKHIIPIDNYGTGRGGRTEKSFRVTNKANGRVVRVLDAKSRSEAERIVQDWLGDEHFARPGAKAEMGANVRRGVDPKKGGQWITGTWDGGTWSAMVFSEPSEAYGIPEFPHISKLAINPKDKPGIGGVIVNYDRGWDIKPSTPELQKAYREIAQAATAEAKKAVKQGWYARTGSKEEMAAGEPDLRSFRLPGEIADVRKKINDYTRALENDLRSGKYTTAAARCKAIGAMYGPGGGSLSWFYDEYADALKNRGYARSGNKTKFAQPPFSASDLNALKRLVQQYDQKAKTSKGVRTETGMNAEWEAISIANHLREIVGYAQAGQTHRAYAQVRMSSPDVVRILPASLVKAAQEVTKLSRPGAKATMGKAASIESDANKAFQLLQQIHKDASVNHPVAKVFSLLSGIIAAARMMERQGYARPGAKAKMSTMDEVVKKYKDIARRVQNGENEQGSMAWLQDVAQAIRTKEHPPETIMRELKDIERAMGFSRPGAKDTNAVREGSKISAEDEACLKMMAAADEKVSDKIRTLIAEGKPQKQAVAIALDLKRREEL